MTHYLSYAEHLLRRIAGSDLNGRGVYVVDAATLPACRQQDPRILGWSHAALDLALGYQRRGMAMVLNLESIRRRGEDTEAEVCGVAIHEASHWLTFPEYLTCERHQLATGRHADFDCYAAWARSWDFRPGHYGDASPSRRMANGWKAPEHGPSWLRAGIHLLWRANQAGFRITAEQCRLGGARYDASPAAEYIAALGDEARNGRFSKIRDVLQSPLPAAFKQLAERDHDEMILRALETIPILEGTESCKSD